MEKVKIKNIFDFQKKSKIKAGDGFKLGEAQYPFYTSSNELTKSINEYLFEDESLIFGTGGLASIHFCNEKFAVSTDCFVIQPKDKNQVFSKFVYYYLSGNMNILENGFKGAGLKHISKDYLENIEIPLPNLATQQRIAAILDQADAIIQNNRAIVQKYDTLTQSLFLDMFGDPVKNEKGWEKRKLGDLSQISSGSTPSRLNDNYFSGNIPWVKTGEVNGKIILDTEEKITKEALENSSCKLYPKGSLIIAMYGQGKTRGQIGFLGIDATTNQACAVIPPSEKINFNYLFQLLKLNYEDLRSLGRGGNQPNLNSGLIKSYEVINPPITLQNQFAERVAVIEAQKQQAQLELAKSEELFNSLLQRAFNGELN